MLFPQTYQLYATSLAEDAVVLVKGRVDRRDDVPKLIAMDLTLPDLSDGPRGPVVISLPLTRCTPPVVERLKEVLVTHPGPTEVHLQLQSATRTKVLRLDDGLRVNPSPALMGDLKALLGAACLS
jgi:DNA polymerase-3 subunit alpha